MIRIQINNQPVNASEGESVLQAAARLGIDIPTMCYLNGYDRYTSCMICVVEDVKSKRLVPSCSTPVMDGMVIETHNETVRAARKDTLDLLLSEHSGDCEAPCFRACPAHMDIPMMIRQIRQKRFEDAIITVKNDIALPAVLGRICSAPCEKGCNRKDEDDSLSICSLKRFVADVDLEQQNPFKPDCKPSSGKRVAVVGSGPAGLSAAYYLLRDGHACDIFDDRGQPGGMLRYGVPDDLLPKDVLDSEIDCIKALGATFRMNTALGKDVGLAELRNDYDAVILTLGATDPELWQDTGIQTSRRGIAIDRQTFQTDVEGVFAGGNAIAEGKMAIRSSAHGKFIAESVDQFLSGKPVTGSLRRFDSVLGRLRDEELGQYMQEATGIGPVQANGGFATGFSAMEATDEAGRCFHCDCRKAESCTLRLLADQYQANQQRYMIGERRPVEKIIQHDLIVYEPGKCIKCGLCVQITNKSQEQLGFTFVQRGFNVRIAVPFNESLKNGLQKVAAECVHACAATAALAWLDKEED